MLSHNNLAMFDNMK